MLLAFSPWWSEVPDGMPSLREHPWDRLSGSSQGTFFRSFAQFAQHSNLLRQQRPLD